MNPAEMAAACVVAMSHGHNSITLVKDRRHKLPKGFPVGERVSDLSMDESVYRYNAERVLAWLMKKQLVTAQVNPTE